MATISACASTSLLPRATLVQKPRPSAVIGLPCMSKIGAGKVRCSMEEKVTGDRTSEAKLGMGASSVMAAAAMYSPAAAMALVDERLSTEGTGLPFGLSNNLLGWLLLGVFALIWSLYIVYASSLEEDEESGLSL